LSLHLVSLKELSEMLLWLSRTLAEDLSFFNAFTYLTMRAILAAVSALTIALLAGFMLGSLNKVWPWKVPTVVYTDSHGKVQPLVERNLLPGTYAEVTGHAAELGVALLLMVVGMGSVVLLDRMGRGDITAHGFRSTFRDWAAEQTNYPRDVAEMALAHAIGDKVEAAYRRGDLFEKRRVMMQDWADYALKVNSKAD
jgi:hypothetical protein